MSLVFVVSHYDYGNGECVVVNAVSVLRVACEALLSLIHHGVNIRHHAHALALGDPPLTRSKAMDRDGLKRGREEQEERGGAGVTPAVVSKKKKKKKKKGKRNETAEGVSESCRVGTVDVFRPPGLFEFPWQKGERLLVPEPEGWDLRDVFFSSLVDGCSAAIGVPGDRLSPAARHPFVLLEEPSDGEVDSGVDCIWSSVLRQPLSMYSKSYTT